jgi:hypothetical protein
MLNSVKREECLEQLSNHRLLKKHAAQWPVCVDLENPSDFGSSAFLYCLKSQVHILKGI